MISNKLSLISKINFYSLTSQISTDNVWHRSNNDFDFVKETVISEK
jgi:hypothetical protein